MKIYCSRDDISFERFERTGLWIKCGERPGNVAYIKVISVCGNYMWYYFIPSEYVEEPNSSTRHMLDFCIKLIDNPDSISSQPYYDKIITNLPIVEPLEILTDEEMKEILINNYQYAE